MMHGNVLNSFKRVSFLLTLSLLLKTSLYAYCYPVSCYPSIAQGKMQTVTAAREYFAQIQELENKLNSLYSKQKSLLQKQEMSLFKIEKFEILNSIVLQGTVTNQEKLLQNKSIQKALK